MASKTNSSPPAVGLLSKQGNLRPAIGSKEIPSLLLDATAEGIVSLDMKGHCTYCNATSLLLLGYDDEQQLLGKNFHELVHHTRRDGTPFPRQACQVCLAALQGDFLFASDEIFWHQDGTSFPVEYHTHPIKKNGALLGAVLTFFDVTDRKRIEMALSDSEKRFQTLAEVSPVGIFHADSQGHFLFVNASWCAITGLSRETAIQKGLSWRIHPDDRMRVLESWCEATGQDRPFDAEFRIQRSEDSMTWVYGQVVAEKNAAGELVGYVGTITDITERKRVEGALRERSEFIETVTDNLPIGLSVTSVSDGAVLYANKNMEKIGGWPNETISHVEQFWVLAVPDTELRHQLKARIAADLASGDPKRMTWEFPIVKQSGETAVILLNEIPMPERQQSISTFQDITERKRAEEALRQSEFRRLQLETELKFAAEVQRNLLPLQAPPLHGFDMAAECRPARQVGGDFYDWQETQSGQLILTFGDVMGKGLAAAMLMTTVRATLRGVTLSVSPASAIQMAEQSLRPDLNNAESFVTLFLAQLDVATALISYVDCGHGFAFIRRQGGEVEELLPRGLPLGVSADETYQEGNCVLQPGDAFVLYSDGLVDAQPAGALDHAAIAAHLQGAGSASEMVERIKALIPADAPLPDDVTILVLRRQQLPSDTQIEDAVLQGTIAVCR
jgi:PAS domain S-box-containing protein